MAMISTVAFEEENPPVDCNSKSGKLKWSPGNPSNGQKFGEQIKIRKSTR